MDKLIWASASSLAGITTILVGVSTPEELEESVMAAQAGPLPPDIQQTLEAL